jgi:hypothetical protein
MTPTPSWISSTPGVHGMVFRPERLVLVIGALAQLVAGPVLADARYADPFAYCAAVGTIDAPDARYTGPPMPAAVDRGLKSALNLPAAAPSAPITGNSRWRCMDGKVYACTVGANLPCSEKADTGREPSPALVDFCRQNPGTEVVPMAVTGRATVFEWRCTGAVPAIVRQFAQPDPAGYIANIWHEIAPP